MGRMIPPKIPDDYLLLWRSRCLHLQELRIPAFPKTPPANLYSQAVMITADTEEKGRLMITPGQLKLTDCRP
jgi:hypothetical protein